MTLGPHATFIVAAYAAAIGILACLIVWVVLDRRRLRRALDELEAKGVTRRSSATAETSTDISANPAIPQEISRQHNLSYAELTDPQAVKNADAALLPAVVKGLQDLGYRVDLMEAPDGLPRSPFFVPGPGEEDVQPALTLVSHHTATPESLTIEETIAQFAFKPRPGTNVYFNTTFWVDNRLVDGKPRIIILGGLTRKNHIALGNRHRDAPNVFNWNTQGVEIMAEKESNVTPEQTRAFTDIAVVYSTAIGRRVQVYAHYDINSNKTPGEGAKGRDAALVTLTQLTLPQSGRLDFTAEGSVAALRVTGSPGVERASKRTS